MSKKLRLLVVGKRHEAAIEPLVTDYENRLSRILRVQWEYIPHTSDNNQAVQKTAESQALLRAVKDDLVILLDERGTGVTSQQLSEKLASFVAQPKDICIIIGGAYGVDEHVKARADAIWSFGAVTFPHQLMRVLLVEQLYRATTIWAGSSYHHD